MFFHFPNPQQSIVDQIDLITIKIKVELKKQIKEALLYWISEVPSSKSIFIKYPIVPIIKIKIDTILTIHNSFSRITKNNVGFIIKIPIALTNHKTIKNVIVLG